MLYQINTRVVLGEIGAAASSVSAASPKRSPATLLRSVAKPGGTLDDLPDSLWDELSGRGLRWVWLLGVWQTGPAGRTVSRTYPAWQQGFREALPDLRQEDIVGSPFAVGAYRASDDFGGEKALAQLRQRLARRGLKLMLDFVPNHVALDHSWLTTHPEWFIRGSADDLAREPANWTQQGKRILAHGRDPYFPGWPDTLQLNYFHPGLRAAMRDELVSIASRCDGVRCDMAMLLLPEVFSRTWGERARPADGVSPVTSEWWPEAIAAARKANPDFVLMAEVYWDLEGVLQQQGFDYTYDKRLYDRLREGHTGAVRDHLKASLDFQNRCARFLENHDEPRAAAVFAPEQHRAAALVTYLTPGLKFFHEGQWDGRTAHASIHLGRRPAEPVNEELKAFYRRLLACVNRPEVQDGRWQLLECRRAWDDNPTAASFLAWMWQRDGRRLLVVVNYGPTQGQCLVALAEVAGKTWTLGDLLTDVAYERNGDDLAGRGLYVDLPAWGGHVFQVTAG